MMRLGFGPTEFLGASAESLKDSLIIYKTLVDWTRTKDWRLCDAQIADVESAIKEKLPNYKPTQFGRKNV